MTNIVLSNTNQMLIVLVNKLSGNRKLIENPRMLRFQNAIICIMYDQVYLCLAFRLMILLSSLTQKTGLLNAR